MSTGTSLASVVAKARHEGLRGTAQRVVRRIYHRLGAHDLDFGLLPEDIADSTRLAFDFGPFDSGQSVAPGPLVVGWLTTPPAAGSGGHTTMFRMIRNLELRGHRCVVLLYDRHYGEVTQQAEVIRSAWPWLRADIRSIDEGLDGLDACVATGWQTAHVLARRATRQLDCFYFIQDYEPFFCARGSEYELAADTYRFGFTNIALGHMVRDRLRTELDVTAHMVPFSCDTTTYVQSNVGPRSGVVFYAKPELPRRGYLIGIRALAEFHDRHPEQEIHIYGTPGSDLPFPATLHGRLTPDELNTLYNRTIAGVAMSFTNISLVAEEMLASGCVPVVNDSADSRADLDNPQVVWALPTPGAIADALCRVIEAPGAELRAVAAAASVRRDDWKIPADGVAAIIEARLANREVIVDDLVRH